MISQAWGWRWYEFQGFCIGEKWVDGQNWWSFWYFERDGWKVWCWLPWVHWEFMNDKFSVWNRLCNKIKRSQEKAWRSGGGRRHHFFAPYLLGSPKNKEIRNFSRKYWKSEKKHANFINSTAKAEHAWQHVISWILFYLFKGNATWHQRTWAYPLF